MNKTFPQRKNPRLHGYDYSQEGMYFVTICTQQRFHHFGHIKDDIMHLNLIGQIAIECWQKIPVHYPEVELDEYIVMPNHVHGIVVIRDMSVNTANTTDGVISADGMYAIPTDGKRGVKLGTIVGTYKAAVTRLVNQQIPYAEKIWQSSYHDHIIRNEKSLNDIRQYVQNNPALWEKDTLFGG